LGLAAFVLLPWYRIDSGFFGLSWLAGFPGETAVAPGIAQILGGRAWLILPAFLLLAAAAARLIDDPHRRGTALAGIGAAGIVLLAWQGFAIGFSGWTWTISESLFGTLANGQPPMGAGAVLAGI